MTGLHRYWLSKVRRPLQKRRFADTRFSPLFESYQGKEMISLDCETTGLDPKTADVLSIGAVKVQGNKVLTSEKLDLKITAPPSLDGESIKIHRLRHMDLQHKLSAEQAIEELLDFIGNRPILGYYIQFDLALLSRYTKTMHDFYLTNQEVELSSLYYNKVNRFYPDAHLDLRFDTLAQTLGVPIMGRHTALGDAVTTALMYIRLHYGKRPKLM